MSDRDEKADEIRERSSQRRGTSDRQERMGRRLQDDTEQNQTQKCQATIRNGDQCSNDATDGRYCDKHQPNEYGELTWQYKRKQWYVDPDLLDEIFQTDDLSQPSLYLDVRRELGKNISQKSFENTAAEFLLEHSDEFIEYATNKYSGETDD